MKKRLSNCLSALCDRLIVKLLGAWLAVSAVVLFFFPNRTLDLQYASDVSLPVVIAGVLLITVALTILDRCWTPVRCSDWFLYGALTVFSVAVLSHGGTVQTYITLAIFLVMAIRYVYRDRSLAPNVGGSAFWLPLLLLVGFFFVVTLVIAVLRYETYGAPNFDFGVFCQMFHYMSTDFVPNTTCERDQLLSHFAVHLSPIYYLLLPFYMIFPTPLTLAVGQVVILFSGAVPLLLLARHKGLSHQVTLFMLIAFAAYPALSGGCFYDIHENCFLLPLLLWMFYFHEKGRLTGVLLSALGVCLVKEDAFLYLVVFAVYVLIAERKWKTGLILLGGSIAYFIGAVFLLTTYGQGIMSGRLGTLIPEGGGLIDAIKTVLVNPGHAIIQLLKPEGDKQHKLLYVIQMFLPLAGLPFLTRRGSRYLLLAPILVNLLTDYGYMHSVYFQYSFGVMAFLFYGAVLNLSEMNELARHRRALTAATLSAVIFVLLTMPTAVSLMRNYRDNYEKYERMDAILEQIPTDVSVTASTFLVPHLSEREVLYEDFYHSGTDTDLLIIDLRGGHTEFVKGLEDKYTNAGYTCRFSEEGLLSIWEAP